MNQTIQQLNVYCVYDSKAEAYAPPMFFARHGEALRWLSDITNSREENMIRNHPEDYILFHVGEFDRKTGSISPAKAVQALGKALDYKKSQQ